MNIWDDPNLIAALKREVAAGASFGACAKTLSKEFGFPVSRNAVIGKAHRLELRLQDGPEKARREAEREANRVLAMQKARQRRMDQERKRADREEKARLAKARKAVPHGFGVDYSSTPDEADLKRADYRKQGLSAEAFVTAGAGVESPNARPFVRHRTGCRWPIGRAGAVQFCCNPVSRGAYCEGHAAVAYNGFPKDHGGRMAAPSVVERIASNFTRHERQDSYRRVRANDDAPIARTAWDAGRDAA